MRQSFPDLSRSTDLLNISVSLEKCRPTVFGDAIRTALRTEPLQSVCRMILEQVEGGNRDEIEWCIGASTLAKIEKHQDYLTAKIKCHG